MLERELSACVDRHINLDPVTGGFNHETIDPTGPGRFVRGRKLSTGGLSRRQFLWLMAVGAGGLAGCTSIGKLAIKTAEVIAAATPEADPTLVAKRVTELRDKAILETQETGRYDAKALARWTELSPQPKIRPEIGVSIMPSKYIRGVGSIDWHTQVAAKLGFQRVAVPINPHEFTMHTGIDLGYVPTLDQLVQYEEFDRMFANPDIKAIHITCDVGSQNAVNGWQFPVAEAFTPEALQATYEEYGRTAEVLLTKYGHLGKEIVIGGPNETELLTKGGYSAGTENNPISEGAYQNMILYFNTMNRAVADANAAHPDKTHLLTGLEVLQIRREIGDENPLTGLDVASALERPVDQLTLSAWQFSGKGEGGYWPEKAVVEMQTASPGSMVGITEYGIADSDRPGTPRDQIAALYKADIGSALAGGSSYVISWGLTCFNSDKLFPNNNETRGLGLIRPDGSIRREVFDALRTV